MARLVVAVTAVSMIFQCVTSAIVSADEKNPYPELKGSRNDSFGSIEWSSTGEDGEGVWTYGYQVKNLGKLNCRVNWDAVGLFSTILPADSSSGSVTGPIELRQVDGKLMYNGGTATGEGTAAAPAWVANDRKPGRCTAKAQIAVEAVKFLFPIEVVAESAVKTDDKSKKYEITYDLKISPAKKAGGDLISANMRLFQQSIVVRWESISSPLWAKKESTSFTWGTIKDSGELVFQKKESESDPLMVAGSLFTPSERPPTIVSKQLVFATFAEDGTEKVVGRALLPAYAPPRDEK